MYQVGDRGQGVVKEALGSRPYPTEPIASIEQIHHLHTSRPTLGVLFKLLYLLLVITFIPLTWSLFTPTFGGRAAAH